MKELKIHFLNTIWSDAIILEVNNKFGFVDTGSSFYYPMIEKHLQEFNITELEFIILTHFHNDHYGNILNIINNYKVNSLYLKRYYGLDGTTSSGYASNEEYIAHEMSVYNSIIELCKAKKINIIYIDDFDTDIYTINFENVNLELYDCKNRLYNIYKDPSSEYYMQKRFNENFNSIAVFIKVNNFNIFLGADATCSSFDFEDVKELSIKMIKQIYHKHNINHIDIYKSCHHGGSGTNTKELCDLLKSNYCIITNTARWLDNYNTFDNLLNANSNVEILTTDHQKYLFTINDEISYQKIIDESLFIVLNKD